MHQFSKKKPCYYCGAPPPSTREHAPPQMMFDGFDSDSITVPACQQHNTDKSMGDRAVVSAAIHCALITRAEYPNSAVLTANVLTAIDRIEPRLDEAAGQVTLRSILQSPPRYSAPLPHVAPQVDIRQWMRHLTGALTWRVLGKHDQHVNWDNAVSWSPGFVPTDNPSMQYGPFVDVLAKSKVVEDELKDLQWHPGWSAEPRAYPSDIYSFSVAFVDPDSWAGNNVAYCHRLYNRSAEWYVLASFSAEGYESLRAAVEQSRVDNQALQTDRASRGG